MLPKEFDEAHDISILTKALDIKVTDEEVEQVRELTKKHDIYHTYAEDDPHFWDTGMYREAGIMPPIFDDPDEKKLEGSDANYDVKNKIRIEKLRNLMWDIIQDLNYKGPMLGDEENHLQTIVNFIKQYLNESICMDVIFWEKVLEIYEQEDNAELFLMVVSQNLEDLWW